MKNEQFLKTKYFDAQANEHYPLFFHVKRINKAGNFIGSSFWRDYSSFHFQPNDFIFKEHIKQYEKITKSQYEKSAGNFIEIFNRKK